MVASAPYVFGELEIIMKSADYLVLMFSVLVGDHSIDDVNGIGVLCVINR